MPQALSARTGLMAGNSIRNFSRMNQDESSKDISSKETEEVDDGADSDRSDHLFQIGKVNDKLEHTAYDGIMLALVCLRDAEYHDHHGISGAIVQFVLVLILLIISVVLQFILISALLITIVKDESERYLPQIITNYTLSLQAHLAQGNSTALPVDHPAVHKCSSMNPLSNTHVLILFVWSSKLMSEFCDVLWRVRTICKMRTCKKDESEVHEQPDGKLAIVRLYCSTKLLLFFMMCLPRFLLALLLYWTSAKFLYFTDRMDILIMKAISLSFIVQLDELMFATFASLSFKLRLAKASFLISQRIPPRDWHMWGYPLAKYMVTVGLAISIVYGFFGQITTFRRACSAYWNVFPDTRPELGDKDFWQVFFSTFFSASPGR
jgi:hypothetical protein